MPLWVEQILRILLAGALSGLIGFQRERVGKPAGLRTHALIGMGAAIFTITGSFTFGTDRMAAGIVTGIGFLGAGMILHRSGGIIEGLTTAATIWLVAAIGVASAAGMYVIATISAGATLIILFIPHLKTEK